MSDDDFIAVPAEAASDNWLICSTGRDFGGKDWFVTTNHIHASDLNLYSQGAKADAELIARLLNWYYNNENAESILQKAEEK